MHFLNPKVLWLLAVLPPLAVLVVRYAFARQKNFIEQYGEWHLFSRFSKAASSRLYWLKALCAGLALAALIFAAARPSQPNARIEYPVGTVDVVAVVDVSRSMATQDYQGQLPGKEYAAGTRLDMAQYVLLNEVIPALGYNQLGVVTFAGSAFNQSFLTDDMPALSWVLKRNLAIGSAPGEGSQLADALNMACALYDIDSPPNHKRVLILFSDGGNDSDEPKLAAAIAALKQRNVEVVIAGVGSKTARPIPIAQLSPIDQQQFAGQQWYTMDGQVVTSSLDEPTLIAIKNATDGRYTHIESPSDFQIGSLVRGVDVKYIRGERELFMYPLWLALFLAVITVACSRELFRRQKRKESQPKSGGGDEGAPGAIKKRGAL
jgi:ribosomal protein L12E/L44/L45/RPP1/RPP2